MSISPSTLFYKARRVLRRAGLDLRYGRGHEPDYEDPSDHPMIKALDRQIDKHMQEMDAAMKRFEDDFMEPYRAFERRKYGGDPPSLLGDGGQLELDTSYDQDQRDLFAGAGR